jgi:hypothetical protein
MPERVFQSDKDRETATRQLLDEVALTTVKDLWKPPSSSSTPMTPPSQRATRNPPTEPLISDALRKQLKVPLSAPTGRAAQEYDTP